MDVMLFSGLACFSPAVPSYIRTLWVKNGGTLTHNEDDFRKANFFFCDGMEDPWLNELSTSSYWLLSRSLIVRHAAWVTLCVVEDFIMPIADYTLDAGFDESKICVLEPRLPGASSASASAAAAARVGISGIQVQKSSVLFPKKAVDNRPASALAPAAIPPFDEVHLVNTRKRRRDDDDEEDVNENEEQKDEEAQERQGPPRKKARLESERYTWKPPQLPPLARRRELPLPFSTVRGARRMIMGVEVGNAPEYRERKGKEKETEKGNRTHAGKTDDVPGGHQISNQVGLGFGVVQSLSVDATSKGFGFGGTTKSRGSKAKRAFEKCIVRSENGVARPVSPPPPPPPAIPGPSLSGNGPVRERGGERPLNSTTKSNMNAHTLFWNDILAKSSLNSKDGSTATATATATPCLQLHVGDLIKAPRTKAAIFDVNKSYLGRRFIYLDNEKRRVNEESE